MTVLEYGISFGRKNLNNKFYIIFNWGIFRNENNETGNDDRLSDKKRASESTRNKKICKFEIRNIFKLKKKKEIKTNKFDIYLK